MPKKTCARSTLQWVGALSVLSLVPIAGCLGRIGEGGSGTGSTESALCASVDADPGRATLRRLNHTQYGYTIQDLFHTETSYASYLVEDSDGSADGFDNNGDSLKSLDEMRLAKLLHAAEEAVAEAIASGNILSCAVAESACRREILANIAGRAYRRPLAPEEVTRLHDFTEAQRAAETLSDEETLALGLTAVLMSPHFLFMLLDETSPEDPASTYALNDHELASRLSYFLWSSMPDDELRSIAAGGELGKPETLALQVDRMLRDDKAKRFIASFANQWLSLRLFMTDQISPDPSIFPDFTEVELKAPMARETELVFSTIVNEDRSPYELLTADFTFVNEPLAAHYGIAGVTGQEFQRVSLLDVPRRGILTHGSVLTLTSAPNRTNVPKRGNWIIEHLTCQPIPEPPPDLMVGDLPEDGGGTLSMRERLEAHRANPQCSGCHQLMDPIGFGLENFDGIGSYREVDGSAPIDPSGEIFEMSFTTHLEMLDIMANRPDFGRCFTTKMFAYALGRSLDMSKKSADRCLVERTAAEHARSDTTFAELIVAIVTSEPFRKQQGEGATD
jgi:hypothetical protein